MKFLLEDTKWVEWRLRKKKRANRKPKPDDTLASLSRRISPRRPYMGAELRRSYIVEELESRLPVGLAFTIYDVADIMDWHTKKVANALNRMINQGYDIKTLGAINGYQRYLYTRR